jgi:hypothetical protein
LLHRHALDWLALHRHALLDLDHASLLHNHSWSHPLLLLLLLLLLE